MVASGWPPRSALPSLWVACSSIALPAMSACSTSQRLALRRCWRFATSMTSSARKLEVAKESGGGGGGRKNSGGFGAERRGGKKKEAAPNRGSPTQIEESPRRKRRANRGWGGCGGA